MTKHLPWAFVFIVLPFVLPTFHLSFDVGTVLTIISLLFAILAGFFIAAATSNYLRLQTLISDENSNLISIYHYARHIEPSAAPALAEAIDKYVIASLDFDQLDFAQSTRPLLDDVVKEVEKIKPTTDSGLSLFQNIHTEKSDLYSTNQEAAMTAKQVVSWRHWVILTILAFLMVLLLLGIRDGGFITNIIVGLATVAIYEVLVLIREVDNNTFLAYQLSYQDVQHIFQSIGKLPYYPEQAFRNRELKNIPKPYRVGYLRGKQREIKVVGQ